jgi:hypothetical protein
MKTTIKLTVFAALLAVMGLCNGCSTAGRQNDVESMNALQHVRDTSFEGHKGVLGVYRGDLSRTSICITNADGSWYENHTVAVDKGFRMPFSGLFRGVGRCVEGIFAIPCAIIITPNYYNNVGYINTTTYYVPVGTYGHGGNNIGGPYGYGVVNRPHDGNTMRTPGAQQVMRAIGPLSNGGGGGGDRRGSPSGNGGQGGGGHHNNK